MEKANLEFNTIRYLNLISIQITNPKYIEIQSYRPLFYTRGKSPSPFNGKSDLPIKYVST